MPTGRRARSVTLVAVVLVLVAVRGRGGVLDARDALELTDTLGRAGERVEAFFGRAQSLVCTETVSIQPLERGLTSAGFARTIESELRLSWEAGLGGPATAQTWRQVLRVNRRAPRKNDPNSCTVPEQNETETQPLSMLLPQQREEYTFSSAGPGRVDGRAALMIDFRHRVPVSVDVRALEDNEDCIAYDLNGGMRGRLWIDTETMDVLRLDQHLAGLVDVRMPRLIARRPGVAPYWTLERWDTSIRFRGVTFTDPEESLVLPLSSTTVQVTRGGGTPRVRTEIKYANYKRFLTGGRVVGN